MKKIFFVMPLFILFSTQANAGGLIGDAINTIAPGVGTQLDEANKNLGNPVDKLAAQAAQANGVPVSPNCATQQGIFNGPFLPIGTPCNVNGMAGIIVQ